MERVAPKDFKNSGKFIVLNLDVLNLGRKGGGAINSLTGILHVSPHGKEGREGTRPFH